MGTLCCPFVLQRFSEDYKMAMGEKFTEIEMEDAGKALVPDGTLVRKVGKREMIMLEDYTFPVTISSSFEKFLHAVKAMLPDNKVIDSRFLNHTVLLSDDDYASFVRNSTEINTRIRINSDTGTVDGNGLFTEEFVPSESIFYTMLFFRGSHLLQEREENGRIFASGNIKREFKRLFAEDIFQIGADTTLGKGIVIKKFWEG